MNIFIFNLIGYLFVINYVQSKTTVETSRKIDIMENNRNGTFIVSLNQLFNQIKFQQKSFNLINFNGFEKEYFELKNENIYTKKLIDREEFVFKRYCSNELSCQIELHLLSNDTLNYLIIPIEILDENDNEPEFRLKEIEIRLNENEMINKYYEIPIEGAKDIDKNREIIYEIFCSNEIKENDCLKIFNLINLSKTNQFDRLTIRIDRNLFFSNKNIRNKFHLKIFAKNPNQITQGNNLKINFQIKRKLKRIEFELSKYEFIILLNSTLILSNQTKYFIGNISLLSENIFLFDFNFQILTKTNKIEINSLTGELFLNLNQINEKDHRIDIQVEFSSKFTQTIQCQVEILIRFSKLINEISIKYQNQNLLTQINQTNAFFIDENLFQTRENLFQIFISSLIYSQDQYDLILLNYQHIFSLLSSKQNLFLLNLLNSNPKFSETIFNLNISIQHRLTKQFLSNLQIQLIILRSYSSTILSTRKTSIRIKLTNQSNEFCQINQTFSLIEQKTKQTIEFLTVINKTNEILMNNQTKNVLFVLKSNQFIFNQCYLKSNENISYENLTDLLIEICFSNQINLCFQINQIQQFLNQTQRILSSNSFLSIKSLQIILLIFSVLFIFLSILLILFVCHLKTNNLSSIFNKCFTKQKSLQQPTPDYSLSLNKTTTDFPIYSYQSNQIVNLDETQIETDYQQEPLPSLSSLCSSLTYSIKENDQITTTPVRTASSSSFLTETKQLLEMISTKSVV